MKTKISSLLLLFCCCFGYSQHTVITHIITSMGTIEVALYPEKAPETVKNFLQYVNNGLYDHTNFFRVCTKENEAGRDIMIEVIQGGIISEELLFAPIAMETTQKTGIKHENGTISMARGTPDSAQSSFFICINAQPELDFAGKRNPDGQGFAAFGKVTKGMDVVLKIQSLENEEQQLITPVQIETIKMQ